MIKSLLFFFSICFLVLSFSFKNLEDSVLWEWAPSDPDLSELYDLVQNEKERLAFVGGSGSNKGDIYFGLVDANTGKEVFLKKISLGKKKDVAQAIIQTSDGGYVFAGYTESDCDGRNKGKKDAFLLKTDERGVVLWFKLSGTTKDDAFYDVIEDERGNLWATGHLNDEICVYKVNWKGEEDRLPNKLYGNSSGQALIMNRKRELVVAGYGPDLTGKANVPVLIQFKQSGSLIRRTFFYDMKGKALDVIETREGEYLLTGVKEGFSGSKNALLLKTDDRHNTLWDRSFGGDYDDQGNCLLQSSSGDFYVVGKSNSEAASDALLMKLDEKGESKRTEPKRLESKHKEYANVLLELQDGSLVLGGKKNKSAWIIKLNTDR